MGEEKQTPSVNSFNNTKTEIYDSHSQQSLTPLVTRGEKNSSLNEFPTNREVSLLQFYSIKMAEHQENMEDGRKRSKLPTCLHLKGIF